MTIVSPTNSQASLPQAGVPVLGRPLASAVAAELKSSALKDARYTPEVQEVSTSSKPVKASAKVLSAEELASQIKELQTKMDKLNPALAFVVDQGSGRAVLQLTDRTTKEVILQFPTAVALQISKALDQFEKGQLISRTV